MWAKYQNIAIYRRYIVISEVGDTILCCDLKDFEKNTILRDIVDISFSLNFVNFLWFIEDISWIYCGYIIDISTNIDATAFNQQNTNTIDGDPAINNFDQRPEVKLQKWLETQTFICNPECFICIYWPYPCKSIDQSPSNGVAVTKGGFNSRLESPSNFDQIWDGTAITSSNLNYPSTSLWLW